jgi:hypothetical protein
MPLVLRSSLEHRVIEYASEHYPVTADELAGALGVQVGKVMMELRRMESKGLVELDVLPDKVFVRLLVLPQPGGDISGEDEAGRSPGNNKKKQGKGGDDPAYF